MNKRNSNEKAKKFTTSLKKLLKFLGNYKFSLIIVIILTVFSTLFSVVGPKYLGDATTLLYEGLLNKIKGIGGIDFLGLNKILIVLISLYLVCAFLEYISIFIVSKIVRNVSYTLRKNISEKIHKLPTKYFDLNPHGETISIITNDVDNITDRLQEMTINFFTFLTTIIGVVIMMFIINPLLAILSIIILPIALIGLSFVFKKTQKYFKNNQDYLAEVNGNVEEMFSGQATIQSYNAEEKFISKFEKNNQKLYENGFKSNLYSGLLQPIMIFIGNLNYVLISVVGGYFVIKGKMKVGNIQSLIQYTKSLNQSAAQMTSITTTLQSLVASFERVDEFLNNEEEKNDYKNDYLLENIKGNIKFDNISFGYNEKLIIKDFNLEVFPGQKIAIVGPTGAGKTTIVKLLMRFYKLNKGKILIDEIDINNISPSDYKKLFGMVLQDTWLFNDTILNNIKYANTNALTQEVIEASKTAYAHDFIQTLPNGYNMVIDEEISNLSSGQKQLITIARAVLTNSQILILDEATSSVDTRTEVLIQKAMDKLLEGKTSFVIAHRLSTIINSDKIIVINKGKIVEVGTHKELLEKGGFYTKLYTSQFKKIE